MNESTTTMSRIGLPADRTGRLISLLALAAALWYLLPVGLRPDPLGVYVKTSMCVLLACLAWRGERKLLAIALLFSAAGDACLAIDGDRLFVPGLASFLVTHVLYSAVFVSAAKTMPAPSSGWRKIAMSAIALFAVANTVVLWPNLGPLAFAVALYIAAIVAMAMLSLRVSAPSVPVGAMLFLVSDSLIALNKFIWQADWIGPWVWVTYAGAQLLITHGLLGRPRRDRAHAGDVGVLRTGSG